MPAYTRGKVRETTVGVVLNSKIIYAFKTKDLASLSGVSQSDLTSQLGHILNPAAGQGANTAGRAVIFGANAPKPPRVTKRLPNATATTQGSVSTFCAPGSLSTAISAGWSRGKGGRAASTNSTAKSYIAICPLGDAISYLFPMNRGDFDLYQQILGLERAGLENQSSTEVAGYIRAANNCYPGKASFSIARNAAQDGTVTGGGRFRSFYNPDKKDDLLTTEGWKVESDAVTPFVIPAVAP